MSPNSLATVGLQEYPKDIKKELIENTDKQTEVKLPQHISSQLGEDKTVFYEGLLKEAPDEFRKIYLKNIGDIGFETTDINEAYYSMLWKKVVMNIEDDFKGSWYAKRGNVFFHEFAHAFDDQISQNKGLGLLEKISTPLGKSIENELNDLIKSQPEKGMTMKRLTLFRQLKEDFSKNPLGMASISDLFGGVSNNNFYMGVGHDSSYWKPRKIRGKKYTKEEIERHKYRMVGAEAFAEMFAANITSPEEIEMFDKYIPKSYKMFLEIINEISR